MDGILNAYHRSSNPLHTKSFEEKIEYFLAYPRTRNIAKKDFETTNCYYTCNEKDECDFSQCIEKINETKFKNEKISKFMKDVVDKHSVCFSPPHISDGILISYKSDNESESTKSIFHMINKNKQNDTRTCVLELNKERLVLLK